MAENSKIEWTTHTWNPWRGCEKVSAGCANCYAETLSHRNPAVFGKWGGEKAGGVRVVASEAQWREPEKWNRKSRWWCDRCQSLCEVNDKIYCRRCGVGSSPRTPIVPERPRVFCASLADVFEDWQGPMVDSAGNLLFGSWVSPGPEMNRPLTMGAVRERLFKLIERTPNLDWLVLTKRPENVRRMIYDAWCPPVPGHVSQNPGDGHSWRVPPNVWFGTSVENQPTAELRIPHLLKLPAAVLFLSLEPLLGGIDLMRVWLPDRSGFWNALTGKLTTRIKLDAGGEAWAETEKPITGKVGWAIVGGESGPGARRCNTDDVQSLVDQCRAARVPVFVKQLGKTRYVTLRDQHGNPAGSMESRSKDGKGGDMSDWPLDLRIREFPQL